MKIIFIISLLFCFNSCNQVNNKRQKGTPAQQQIIKKEAVVITEKFEEISITELNIKLSQKIESLLPKDIMKVYYPHEVTVGEGNEKIIISEKTLNSGNIEVKLIHDNLLDDSVKGEKYIMELKKQGDNWVVVSLKKNWKCWRGHSNWGIKLCH